MTRMKCIKTILLVFAILLLNGCKQESSNSTEDSFVGTWVTEQCKQLTDSDGNSVPVWAKGEYTFTREGSLIWRFVRYDDSSCITGSSPLTATAISMSFEDLGTETLEDGLVGHRLHLQWIEEEKVTLDRQNIFAVFLAGNRLCTSENLRLGASSILYSDMASTQINYEECLTSGELS